MTEAQQPKNAASPYASGGGGVVFEHKVMALALARLLTAGPVTALDDRAPHRVAFQQAPRALADDVVLTSLAADGADSIRLDLAVRRAPKFIKSNGPTGELVTALVRADLAAERGTDPSVDHRLGVVVSGPNKHAQELAELAHVARGQSEETAFTKLIRTPGKFKTTPRLEHLIAMVSASLDVIGEPSDMAEHRTWRLLQRLWMWQIELEVGHEQDWTRLVDDLEPVSRDGSRAAALALRGRLADLAAELDLVAADLDEPTLRRRLHGHLGPAVRLPKGWDRLLSLDAQARAATARSIAAGSTNELRLPRAAVRQQLRGMLASGTEPASGADTGTDRDRGVLVTGDSGVGKSALVLDATTPEELDADSQALAVHLRHLPRTVLELTAHLQTPLQKQLAHLTAPNRMLVIDGAEAAAEDWGDVLAHLLTAARGADVRPVVVSTTEGAELVKGMLKVGGTDPVTYHVDGLDDDELTVVAEQFPGLRRLVDDERGRDLLRRPIVVELLASTDDPGVPLSESQALDLVWRSLVRNNERRADGAPDARQEVMLRLADHEVRRGDVTALLDRLDHDAVDGLRRSGLLQPASSSAWHRVPAFRHDLIRAYALARLLLADADPSGVLASLDAPRWTLPSARLACEMLLSARDEPALPASGRFARTQTGFDALVEAGHGERWSDLPTEALLLTPDPNSALEQAWPTLTENEGVGVARLIRLVNVRHRREGLIDPRIAAAVVGMLLRRGIPRAVKKEAQTLIIEWLQALVLAGASAGDPLRVQLREIIVAECAAAHQALDERDAARAAELAARSPEQVAQDEARRKRFNAFTAGPRSGARSRRRRRQSSRRPYEWITDDRIETLALLGPDIGTDGETILRRIADDDPYKLEHAVEVICAGHSLASYSPALLADLTMSYYIDEPEEDDDEIGFGRFGGYGGLGDDGIRDHRYHGLGLPLMHLSKGPFLALFRVDYGRGVQVLNRMLDHAARYREALMSRYERRDPESEESASGTLLGVCGEPRRLAGDAQVWLWYRGTGVGPYPCMSALQALEFVTEEIISMSVPPPILTAIMLKDCHNLAMPALALAVLGRHLDAVGDALDPFLVEPIVWQLEFSRVTHESSGMAAQLPNLAHPERRGWSMREIAMMLALNADADRANALKHLGEQLEANARAEIKDENSQGAQQHLAAVRNWARALDRNAYEMTPGQDGWLIQQSVDPRVEQVLGDGNARLRRINAAVGLTLRHANLRDSGGRAPELDDAALAADVVLARDLVEDPPDPADLATDGPVAVAASVLELHLTSRNAVADDAVLWAATGLLSVSANVATALAAGPTDEFDDSFFPQGADRSAARGLPYLLLPAAGPIRASLGIDAPEDVEELLNRMRTLAVDGANESRLCFARALDAVWAQPCDTVHLFGSCHHTLAYQLVQESFLPSRLGDWDRSGRRNVIDLDPPSIEGLRIVEGDSLLVRRLSPAVRAAGAAAATQACCAPDAEQVLDALLAAHRRGMLAHDGYHHSDSDALVVARAALTQAVAGRDQVVLDHVSGLLENAKVLAEALRALGGAADEHAERGLAAQRLWPAIMDRVLDAAPSGLFAERTWGDYAEATLIPTPSADWSYLTRELAGEPVRWRDLVLWAPQVERWVTTVPLSRMAIDHLVIAVSELDVTAQIEQGLRWIEQAVERAEDSRASTYTLPEWLRDRRADLRDDAQGARWQRIVDLLVVAGDSRVADLSD